MRFGQAISTCFAKYATFSDRAPRSEFWWFLLFHFLVLCASAIVSEILYAVIALGLLLPSLAVGSRRLRDMGKSGWWMLLVFTGIGYLLLLYWWAQPAEDVGRDYAPTEITR